jgi:error-prone DNA polymerase
VAQFTGGEAEDLRRAMGFKRSEERMQKIEAKLRIGMTANGIEPDTQERIIQAISSFALYGFPESHAASFALLAYASAYLKCHYLAAFTVCLLNHQPMGFYSAATVVKDAQRHGQHFRPVDVQVSGMECRIERVGAVRSIRLGFNYVKGLSAASAATLVQAREQNGPFQSLTDLRRRVPELNKKEVTALAELGALNGLPQRPQDRHRRGASWQAQAAAQRVGPLLESLAEDGDPSPLEPMTPKQCVQADFAHSGLTIGSHPMAFCRAQLQMQGILTTARARERRDGAPVRVAGCVITRQRPETAKGFVFLSLEDETGILNVIVSPAVFDRDRRACLHPYVLVGGILQNTWTVVSVKAHFVQALSCGQQPSAPSHDFC